MREIARVLLLDTGDFDLIPVEGRRKSGRFYVRDDVVVENGARAVFEQDGVDDMAVWLTSFPMIPHFVE